MASFSSREIEEFYTAFKQAYLALASGVKSYSINVGGSSRSVTRADLPQIKGEFLYWSRLRDRRGNKGRLDVSYVEVVDR